MDGVEEEVVERKCECEEKRKLLSYEWKKKCECV